MYEKYGITSWSFDSIFEFRDRRNKAWSDYGSFLHVRRQVLFDINFTASSKAVSQ